MCVLIAAENLLLLRDFQFQLTASREIQLEILYVIGDCEYSERNIIIRGFNLAPAFHTSLIRVERKFVFVFQYVKTLIVPDYNS